MLERYAPDKVVQLHGVQKFCREAVGEAISCQIYAFQSQFLDVDTLCVSEAEPPLERVLHLILLLDYGANEMAMRICQSTAL